jgi:hypothetical protein
VDELERGDCGFWGGRLRGSWWDCAGENVEQGFLDVFEELRARLI